MDNLFWVIFGIIGLITLVAIYMWWYRGKRIRNRLLSTFENPATLLSETVSKDKVLLLQQVGSIDCYTQPTDEIAIFTYRYWLTGEHRYLYYIGIEFQNLNLKYNIYAGIYGSGCPVDSYTDPHALNKKAKKLSEFKPKLSVPDGYSMIEVNRKNIVVFYLMPIFVGYGKMKDVAQWLRHM